MGWVDGRVEAGDRVALDVSRMSLNGNQNIIMRGGDDMGVMFLMDDACVSRFDSRGARVPNGVECHRAFGDTEYKGQPARLLEVCMDSSSVKIYDENNQPVKDDSSPKRSLNIYTLVQVNGQWKIATHDFPNNPDC